MQLCSWILKIASRLVRQLSKQIHPIHCRASKISLASFQGLKPAVFYSPLSSEHK